MRRALALLAILSALLLAAAVPAGAQTSDADAEFQVFLERTVWPAAKDAGVSRETFAAATDGLAPDLTLPDLRKPGQPAGLPSGAWQAEFTSPARYLDESNLAALTRTGRRLAGTWGDLLAGLERETGVPAGIVLAIWGRESNFGKAPMRHPTIRALATQAFMGSRPEIFLPELIAALSIIEGDHLDPADMRGSWAGAMGQPQFMPSKFLDHARDGDGDGDRDIWGSVPDTLASIAHYLMDHGWVPGRPWGREVTVPAAISCALEGPDQGRPIRDWVAAGVAAVDGGELGPADSLGFLLMPAGRHGPAFLVSENFYVLKRYNESDLYALFIGHLADRMAGPARIRGAWTASSGFTRGDVRRLQERLIAAGHDVGGADGLVGFRTRVAIGRSQAAAGLAPTCFPRADDFR